MNMDARLFYRLGFTNAPFAKQPLLLIFVELYINNETLYFITLIQRI